MNYQITENLSLNVNRPTVYTLTYNEGECEFKRHIGGYLDKLYNEQNQLVSYDEYKNACEEYQFIDTARTDPLFFDKFIKMRYCYQQQLNGQQNIDYTQCLF